MKRYLLKINTNWADEIDIDGCCVLTEEQYKKFITITEQMEKDSPFYMCIGTNEEIECYWNQVANDFSIKEITEEQFRVLESLDILDIGFANSFYETIVYDE